MVKLTSYSPYRVLPFISKVRNAYFDEQYVGDADVVIASGHSAAGDYSKARRAIVFADSPHVDEAAARTDRGLSARKTIRGLRTSALDGKFDTGIDPESVPPGARIIRVNGQAVGVVTDRAYAFPSASAQADSAWLHRLYLDAAKQWRQPGAAPADQAGKVFRSDTGELVLDRVAGVFTAITPRARIAMGFLGAAGEVKLGDVVVTCRTGFASISLVSLDGRPIAESKRLLLTAVARSENTGQAVMNNHSSIPERGRPPVLCEPVDATVRLKTSARMAAWSLTPRGRKRARVDARTKGGACTVATVGAKSPWVLLVAE